TPATTPITTPTLATSTQNTTPTTTALPIIPVTTAPISTTAPTVTSTETATSESISASISASSLYSIATPSLNSSLISSVIPSSSSNIPTLSSFLLSTSGSASVSSASVSSAPVSPSPSCQPDANNPASLTCPSGKFCNYTLNACYALLSAGSYCTDGNQCQSTSCTNNACDASATATMDLSKAAKIAGIVIGVFLAAAVAFAIYRVARRRREPSFDRGRSVPSMVFANEGNSSSSTTSLNNNYPFASRNAGFGNTDAPFGAQANSAYPKQEHANTTQYTAYPQNLLYPPSGYPQATSMTNASATANNYDHYYNSSARPHANEETLSPAAAARAFQPQQLTAPAPAVTYRDSHQSNGARLSKYNYLTKAFSHMRSSTLPGGVGPRDSGTLSPEDLRQQQEERDMRNALIASASAAENLSQALDGYDSQPTQGNNPYSDSVTVVHDHGRGESSQGTKDISDEKPCNTLRDSALLPNDEEFGLNGHESLYLGLDTFKMEPLDSTTPAPSNTNNSRYKMQSVYSTYSRDSELYSSPPVPTPGIPAKFQTGPVSPTTISPTVGSKYDFLSHEPASPTNSAHLSDISRGSGFITLHAPIFKAYQADAAASAPVQTPPPRASPVSRQPLAAPQAFHTTTINIAQPQQATILSVAPQRQSPSDESPVLPPSQGSALRVSNISLDSVGVFGTQPVVPSDVPSDYSSPTDPLPQRAASAASTLSTTSSSNPFAGITRGKVTQIVNLPVAQPVAPRVVFSFQDNDESVNVGPSHKSDAETNPFKASKRDSRDAWAEEDERMEAGSNTTVTAAKASYNYF
ncbi:hypothetical protein BC938DRAFT_474161, partial [Jimgerdemannia flammicorona]